MNKERVKGFKFVWIIFMIGLGIAIEFCVRRQFITSLSFYSVVNSFLCKTFFNDNAVLYINMCTTVGSITFSIFSLSKSTLKSNQKESNLTDELCDILNINIYYNSYIFIAILVQITTSLLNYFAIFYLMMIYQIYSFIKCLINYLTIIEKAKFSKKIIKSINQLKRKNEYDKLIRIFSLYFQKKSSLNESMTYGDDDIFLEFDTFVFETITNSKDDNNLDGYKIYSNCMNIITKIKDNSLNKELSEKVILSLYQSISSNENKKLKVFNINGDLSQKDMMRNFIFFATLIFTILKTDSEYLYENLINDNRFNLYKEVLIIIYFEILRFNKRYSYLPYQNLLYDHCIYMIKLFATNIELNNKKQFFFNRIWLFENTLNHNSYNIYNIGISCIRFENAMFKIEKIINEQKNNKNLFNKHMSDIDFIDIIKYLKEYNYGKFI